MKILLALTGSVAMVLAPKTARALRELGDLAIVMTPSAERFLDEKLLDELLDVAGPRTVNALSSRVDRRGQHRNLFVDEDEWRWSRDPITRPDEISHVWRKDDPVLHIELRKWADVLVIAPLSANTLAKAANGLCDNLLTSVIRAWDVSKPIVVAPAMNTMMWEHPLTGKNLHALSEWADLSVVNPVEKGLACGETGVGAMAQVEDVAMRTKDSLRWWFPLRNECPGIPVEGHPGAFGVERRERHHHTGVDLYVPREIMEPRGFVVAAEGGVVVGIEPFTGAWDGTPHWEETSAVLVEGRSGVVCYGEVRPAPGLRVGDRLRRGEKVGQVIPVLKPGKERGDIPGHSRAMLHVELYAHGRHEASTSWVGDDPRHDYMMDPTDMLLDSIGAPGKLGDSKARP